MSFNFVPNTYLQLYLYHPLKFSKERIRLAKSMFMTENKKYIDIAFECGFNSVSSFNRSFKKVKGISPREFKNAMIKSL